MAMCGQPAQAAPLSGSPRLTYIAAGTDAGTSEVMLASANGENPQPLGPASTAVLSPNGDFVAAVVVNDSQSVHTASLVLYSAAKKRPARTLRQSSGQLTLLAWSPDSREIAVIDGNALLVLGLHGRARTIATGTITGASFAPTEPDKLVYARAASLLVDSKVNLYTAAASGGPSIELTYDGLSQDPLWGPKGIVYSHEASSTNPDYQLWLIQPDGDGARQLTTVTVSPPFSGLEPIAFSKNGTHLLANMNAPDSAEAWGIDLGGRHAVAHDLSTPGVATIGNAISRSGQTVLVTDGYGSTSDGDLSSQSVAAVPWTGGLPTVLALHAAFASWTR
jgi:hypothetical protein